MKDDDDFMFGNDILMRSTMLFVLRRKRSRVYLGIFFFLLFCQKKKSSAITFSVKKMAFFFKIHKCNDVSPSSLSFKWRHFECFELERFFSRMRSSKLANGMFSKIRRK